LKQQHIANEWRARLTAAGLDRLEHLLAARFWPTAGSGRWTQLTKAGLGGRQRWRWQLNGRSDPVLYLKRYRRTPIREQWDRSTRQTVLHSRAWWEYQVSRQLLQSGIRSPRAVAYVEDVLPPFERSSALLLEGVSGDALDRVWPPLAASDAPVTHGLARQDLCVRLARFVAAFHGTGFCHRDLYLCHIFVQLDPQGLRPPQFSLIDLARTHRPRLRMRWIIKDLGQLDVSARQIGATRADRLRFLLAYLGLQRGTPRVRYYVRRIVRKSDGILRRLARKARRP
jgi:heptose I phosphotransferase